MKAEVVPALRERGLHHPCGAEPQADGDTIGRHHLNNRESPINSMERKADTMKTYILRDSDVVEPQIQSLNCPTNPAGAAKICFTHSASRIVSNIMKFAASFF